MVLPGLEVVILEHRGHKAFRERKEFRVPKVVRVLLAQIHL